MGKNSENETLSNYIDRNVIILMVVVLLLSTSILSFKILNYYPCEDVSILVDMDDEIRVGELIKFRTSTTVEKTLEWDFGDSITMSNVNEISHSFDTPGTYNVSLNINGGTCEKFQEIVVLDKKKLIDSTKIPMINIPDHITVGEELVAVGINKVVNGEKWEWDFGEIAEIVTSEDSIATYTYKTSGTKTVTLVVNGDNDHRARKYISVYPKEEDDDDISVIVDTGGGPSITEITIPDGPTGETGGEDEDDDVKVPFISERGFEIKLVQVAKQQISERDFLKYFCGDISKTIIANGKEMSFQKFCNDRKGKKIRVKELQLFKDERGCINTISIEYKKRW